MDLRKNLTDEQGDEQVDIKAGEAAATFPVTPPHVYDSSLSHFMVINIYRNPKDVMYSYFDFSNKLTECQAAATTEEFQELFLEGKAEGSLWFDHIRGWYEHRSHFNIHFVLYEDMNKDLRNSVSKVYKFLGKELNKEAMDDVVRQTTFQNMKYDPLANYENILNSQPEDRRKEDSFLHEDTIGDWKNHMTVEQNERFDKIFQSRMKDFPLSFIWDVNEE
ncbi:hypothetical protein HPG69_014348 [Diceros bicornis minor]|uniref:Sulfotransferase n=1 Tax=Diceros bicornis minor TaxID=77932 RepID=A0A7J7EVY8_DICBM|nr:hypothetical protein HPG69_014348 [Diceros bicornis minor]